MILENFMDDISVYKTSRYYDIYNYMYIIDIILVAIRQYQTVSEYDYNTITSLL